MLLDLAEAIRFLKQERGFSHVILQGHSGGGGVVAYYQNQAKKSPPNRIKHTPAGDPPDLNEYDLPPADGLIISAAHLGRGYAVARKLDPSVVDEDDPLSVDPTLDPFNPENGFRLAPQSSQFSEDFVKRFQTAQRARMDRLIAKAREMVAERKMYQQLLEAPDFEDRSVQEQLRIQRGAVLQRYMTIYRNFANLYYLDLNQDPNDRVLGGLGDYRPDLRNYYAHFHPRNIIPEAFLRAESLASNVFTPKLLPEVEVPLLVILGSADPSARISESRTHYDVAGSEDKEFVLIEGGDHGYLPAGPKAGKGDQRERVIEALAGWKGAFHVSSATIIRADCVVLPWAPRRTARVRLRGPSLHALSSRRLRHSVKSGLDGSTTGSAEASKRLPPTSTPRSGCCPDCRGGPSGSHERSGPRWLRPVVGN